MVRGGEIGTDAVERLTRYVVALVVGLGAAAFCAAAWYVPFLAAAAMGRPDMGPGSRIVSLSTMLAGIGLAWCVVSEPADSPHPALSRASLSVRSGGWSALAVAASACLGALSRTGG